MKLVLLALLLISSVTWGQTSILDLEMGKPIHLPECAQGIGGETACKRTHMFIAPYDNVVMLEHLSGSPEAMGHTVDDNLEDLKITYSDSWCGKAERGLKEKFGNPTKVTKAPFITKLGIHVDVIDKQWNRKDGTTMDFVQPGLQTDECVLSGTTAKWRMQKRDDAIKF
jgi:hypothetical protein